MNDIFEVVFLVQEDDVTKWEGILEKSLDSGRGFGLQGEVKVFGSHVERNFNEALGDCNFDIGALNLFNWSRENNKFILEFHYYDIDYLENFKKIFSALPVDELDVLADWE